MSHTQEHNITNNPLFPFYLFLAALTAYAWAAPLRDLYGIEARNGLFIKTMIADGPTLIPQVMGAPYFDYPPLYFWLSWLFSLPAGRLTTLSAILPSALAAAALVGVTFQLARKDSRQTTAMLAALALATCPDFWLKAERATIDMLLAAWVSLAVFFLYRGHRQPAGRAGLLTEIAAFVMMFAAFFTKGPVGLVLPVGIWSVFLISARQWRRLVVFALKSALLAAAAIGIELLFLWKSGGMGLIGKVFEAQLGGRVGDEANEPVWYYLLYLLSGAAPWWIAAFFGFLRTGRERGLRGLAAELFSDEPMRLAACWFCFVLALFTAASSRHSRYLLPLFPALFLLIGRGIELWLERGGWLARAKAATAARYGFLVLVLAATVMFAVAPLGFRPPPLFWLAWLLCSLLGYAMISRNRGQNFPTMQLALLGVGCAMAAEAMLVEPWIAARESGRRFIEETESKINPAVPIVLYRLHPDGDGLKYALYSGRRSDALRFAADPAELHRLSPPFALVAWAGSAPEPAAPGQGESVTELCRGTLHQKEISSWLFGEGGATR